MVRTKRTDRTVEKPPYRVPTMAEIAEVRGTNGYDVVSLFAGGGGSSTGYEMAGFRVVWANEFLPHARAVYAANHPETILDGRDIRQVQPEEILEAIGKKPGELDVLDGSPPCDPFSTAGKREKGWGKKKSYYGGKAKQRTDDLFFEYIRILKGLRPKVFVAENVAGLVKGKAKGYFLEILAAFKATGYNVEARVLDAQWLGVPQTRSRLFFIGAAQPPRWPTPLPFRHSIREAIGVELTAGTTGWQKHKSWRGDHPSPAICAWGLGGVREYQAPVSTAAGRPRVLTIEEVGRLCSYPDDYINAAGDFNVRWQVYGMSVPPLMMRAIALKIREMLDEMKESA